MLKRTKSRKDLRAEGMAVSAPRRSFGFDSSSSTPSPRSSPPLGFQSRLPVRNRNGSSTPQRKVSGATSTATRVALTPVHGRNTPSPHPRSDDKPHVKVVYSPRAEDKHKTSPSTSSDSADLSELVDKDRSVIGPPKIPDDKHHERKSSDDDSLKPELPAKSPKRVSINSLFAHTAETTITVTPSSPAKSIGKAQTCEEPKQSLDMNNLAASNARSGVNFSHPNKPRSSLGNKSTRSTSSEESSSVEARDSPVTPVSTQAFRPFPPRTTSRQALTEQALSDKNVVNKSDKNDREQGHSATAKSHLASQDQQDTQQDGFRTIRLSLNSNSTFGGPTLRIADDADSLLKGQHDDYRSTSRLTGRLRMPSFTSTSSEDTLPEKEINQVKSVKDTVKVAKKSDDEYVLVESNDEKRDVSSTSSDFSVVDTEMNKLANKDDSEEGEAQDTPVTESKTTDTTVAQGFKDRRVSPHTTLLFNRALQETTSNDARPVTSGGLSKLKTTPNIELATSPAVEPPTPPPKDSPATVKSAKPASFSAVSVKKAEALKMPPPSIKTGLRMPRSRAGELGSPRPSHFVEHGWGSATGTLDSFSYANRMASGSTRNSMGISQEHNSLAPMKLDEFSGVEESQKKKKLPRSTSKPRLVMSNIKTLFSRRSHTNADDPVPSPALPSTKISMDSSRPPPIKNAKHTISPLHFTPSSSPISVATWTPPSTMTLGSPTRIPTARSGFKPGMPYANGRPPTRGKSLTPAQAETKLAPSNDETLPLAADDHDLRRATELALQLTSLASQVSPSKKNVVSRAGVDMEKKVAIALARTLVSTITAAREAESAMVSAKQKAEEARLCWEGCKVGVREVGRLVAGVLKQNGIGEQH